MSAQNLIPSKIVEGEIIQGKIHQPINDNANTLAIGIILLVLAVLIMSGALIFMCLSGGAGESTLLLGIAPFILMFMVLLCYK